MKDAQNVACPHCNGLIENDPVLAGQEVSCPHCDGLIVMPGRATPPPRKKSVPQELDFKSSAATRPSSSRSQMPANKTMHPWLKYGLIAFASIVVLRGCIGIIGGGSVSNEEFKDNIANYKGKVVSLQKSGHYITTTPIREKRSAAQDAGSEHYEIAIDFAQPNFILYLKVPANIEVPALEHADRALVTFRCTEGSLTSGNVVTSIKRDW